jgi:hypothetical protein
MNPDAGVGSGDPHGNMRFSATYGPTAALTRWEESADQVGTNDMYPGLSAMWTKTSPYRSAFSVDPHAWFNNFVELRSREHLAHQAHLHQRMQALGLAQAQAHGLAYQAQAQGLAHHAVAQGQERASYRHQDHLNNQPLMGSSRLGLGGGVWGASAGDSSRSAYRKVRAALLARRGGEDTQTLSSQQPPSLLELGGGRGRERRLETRGEARGEARINGDPRYAIGAIPGAGKEFGGAKGGGKGKTAQAYGQAGSLQANVGNPSMPVGTLPVGSMPPGSMLAGGMPMAGGGGY